MFQEWLSVFCNHWQNYQQTCPVAPYTGYIALGFFTLVFFGLWRNAATKVSVLTAVNTVLEEQQGSTVIEESVYDPQEVLETIRSIQQNALDTVRVVQADALTKMERAHQSTLQQIANIVHSFTNEAEEE